MLSIRYLFLFIIITIIILIASGCAQQVGPTGGKKDEKPPEIVESEPENYSTGFKGHSILLRFDEFVQLKDFHSKLIVSPPLKEIPEIKIKGKTLELAFNDTLHANTTYNFQFGDGIVDNNEGNPLDSNLFVFSTGDKIDSLLIKGRIRNAFNLNPEKEVMVLLYDNFSDSLPYNFRPLYFSKTRDDGSFMIPFLKDGDFKLFALKDANGNYLYDLPEERIGFLEKPVVAGDSNELEIILFQEDIATQFFKRGYAEQFGKLVFAFSKKTEKAKAIPLNHSFKNAWYIEELSEKKDSLIYWLITTEKVDTLQLQIWEGNQVLDTAEIILPQREEKEGGKARGRGSFPEKLSISSQNGPFLDLFSPLFIESIHPVKSYDISKIILADQKDTLKIKIAASGNAQRKFEIQAAWKENTEYNLFLPPGVFEDIFGLQNDTFRLNFRTRKKADYGTIKLTLQFENPGTGQYIIQLMDEKENIVKEKLSDGKTALLFENVLASQYKLKMIYDRNKNSIWDTGNYLQKLQPEKVIYYSSKVELRPKFDLDIEWKDVPPSRKR